MQHESSSTTKNTISKNARVLSLPRFIGGVGAGVVVVVGDGVVVPTNDSHDGSWVNSRATLRAAIEKSGNGIVAESIANSIRRFFPPTLHDV